MITREPIVVQPSAVYPKSSNVQAGPSNIKTGGQSTIDHFLSPRNMQYLRNLPPASTVPCRQVQEVHGIAPPQIQETQQVQPGDLVISEPIQMEIPQPQPQQQPSKKPDTTVYVPKVVESSHIVLVPTPAKKSTPLRSGLSGPVPEELQNKTCFYCKNCPGNYTTKDELTRHEQNMCGKKVPEYICDSCDKTYYWPNPLREHYYKEHVKVVMYHCHHCNKGFNYSNKLSVHSRTKCPNKDGPEIYDRMIELDQDLEEKFKPKLPVEITNPEAIQQQEDVQEVEDVAGEDVAVEEGDAEKPKEPLAQELLMVIQQHEQDLQIPSGVDLHPIEVPPCTQSGSQDLVVVKDDDEDDGQDLLDIMSKGIIPGNEDEENGGTIKPEEDALLD